MRASQEEEFCCAPHPGVLSCSSTQVNRDPEANKVVVSVTATVQITGPNRGLGLADLEELGLLAARVRERV